MFLVLHRNRLLASDGFLFPIPNRHCVQFHGDKASSSYGIFALKAFNPKIEPLVTGIIFVFKLTNNFKMRTICNVEFVVFGCGGLCLSQEEHTALVRTLRAIQHDEQTSNYYRHYMIIHRLVEMFAASIWS